MSAWSLQLNCLTEKWTTGTWSRAHLLKAVYLLICSFRRYLWAYPEPGTTKTELPSGRTGGLGFKTFFANSYQTQALRLVESSVVCFSSAFREFDENCEAAHRKVQRWTFLTIYCLLMGNVIFLWVRKIVSENVEQKWSRSVHSVNNWDF